MKRSLKLRPDKAVETPVDLDSAPPAFAHAITGLVQEVFDQLISRGVRALAICGVAEGDGASLLAASLAKALGQAEVSTLLVNADIRKTRLPPPAATSGAPESGLADLLTQPNADADATIQFNVSPGLSVLMAGEPAAGVADALSDTRFAKLMERWLREFEFVIVDTPPANLSPDALRIARLAGSALIVVRRDETFVSDLQLLIEELREQGVTILGSVLSQH